MTALAPATVETLLEARRRAEAAGHGGKEAVYVQTCGLLGISRATLARQLKAVAMTAPRKRRSDAGQTHLSLADAQRLSVVLMEGYRANDKCIQKIDNALLRCRANWPGFAGYVEAGTGEIRSLSAGACSRALRGYGLHPAQLRQAAPVQRQRSLHPNDVWQIDASISTLFYVPEGGVADMAPGVFYKNKPENFERIRRQRLTRYVITDHYSGAIFVHYVAGGESVANMAQSFLLAMQPRPGQEMYGVPFHLCMDPGSAGMGGAMKNLLRALHVTPVVNKAGNPRAKGQVENAHNLAETDFESGFKFAYVPGIAWINEQAALWMRYYNGVREHSRHGQTRYAKWREITPEQLRTVDAGLARGKLVGKPATPTVTPELEVRFEGRRWSVRNVPGVMVGGKLHVTLNPFVPDSAYVIATGDDGREQLIEVPQVLTDQGGFAMGAALIGREFKSPPDTLAEGNRKRVERIATGAPTSEQAAAARKRKALPLGGAFDPYRHHEDSARRLAVSNVTVLPRRGTALEAAGPALPAPALLSAEEAMFRLVGEIKDRHGIARRLTPDEYAFYTARFKGGVTEEQIARMADQAAAHEMGADMDEPQAAAGGLRRVK